MPFDFMKNKVYTINYDEIFNEIMEKKILSRVDIQTDYLRQWMLTLKKHDSILIKQFNSKKAIMDYLVKVQSEPEIFQLPIHWKCGTTYLHFRATIANEIVKKFYSQSAEIPMEEFEGETQCIHWTKVEGDIEEYAASTQPILAVPYFSGKNNLLVIDGNHRLTYAVKHKFSHVRTLIISEQSVIEFKIFSSSFDMMLYIFNNELIRFGNRTAEGYNDDLLQLQKSYLCGSGF